MAGVQIATSVTIISSLLGFQAISYTNLNTSAATIIAAGSKVEIGGAFFNWDSNETVNATSWSSITTATTAYIALTPSGTAGSQIITASYVSTLPVWSSSKQGWYISTGSVVRVIGSVYKTSATQYDRKRFLGKNESSLSEYRLHGKVATITSGSSNWTVPDGVYKLLVTCVGGGGGGGGGDADGTYDGGGGGGILICQGLKQELHVVPGQSISYSVGSGGAAGSTANSPTNGSSGGTTTFGTLSQAGGGGGKSGKDKGGGGVGALGGFGDSGGYGGGASIQSGGKGGGAGGIGGTYLTPASAGNYGGGGGGGIIGGTSSEYQPGAGGSGIIIIEY